MSRSSALTIAIAAVLATALLTPLRRELFAGDETKYSQIVREMVASGRWFLPTLEGTPFTHKPPVHFWLVGALTTIFGTYSIWSFVLPSLIAFALLLWLVHRIGGPLAAFVCATSLMVWGSAQSARMDVSFTALIALAIWMLEKFFEADDAGRSEIGERRWEIGEGRSEIGGESAGSGGDEAHEGQGAPGAVTSGLQLPISSLSPFQSRRLLLASLSIAVATLIKGPMAPVIAVAYFALESWRRRRVPPGPYVSAVAILAVVPLLWFLPATLVGGDAYTQEVLKKQIAGRAVGSWVHKSPPWYYLLHAPGFLFPWFGAFAVALVARWRQERSLVSWILAVFIPYTLMTSKLDVYMMVLIPAVSILIARSVDARGMRMANGLTAGLMLVLGAAGLVAGSRFVKGPEKALISSDSVRGMLVVLAVAALAALLMARRSAFASILALGMAPIATFAYVAVVLMPLVNEMASPRPLIRALAATGVQGSDMELYACPHLWSRTMPPQLEGVRYVSPETIDRPRIIATSRSRSGQIAKQLVGYHRVAQVRMIGKWFDVYRR